MVYHNTLDSILDSIQVFTCLPRVTVDVVLVVEVRIVQLSEGSKLQFSLFVSSQVYQQCSTSSPHLREGAEERKGRGGEGEGRKEGGVRKGMEGRRKGEGRKERKGGGRSKVELPAMSCECA